MGGACGQHIYFFIRICELTFFFGKDKDKKHENVKKRAMTFFEAAKATKDK